MIKPRQTEPYQVPSFITKANKETRATIEPSDEAIKRQGITVTEVPFGVMKENYIPLTARQAAVKV